MGVDNITLSLDCTATDTKNLHLHSYFLLTGIRETSKTTSDNSFIKFFDTFTWKL